MRNVPRYLGGLLASGWLLTAACAAEPISDDEGTLLLPGGGKADGLDGIVVVPKTTAIRELHGVARGAGGPSVTLTEGMSEASEFAMYSHRWFVESPFIVIDSESEWLDLRLEPSAEPERFADGRMFLFRYVDDDLPRVDPSERRPWEGRPWNGPWTWVVCQDPVDATYDLAWEAVAIDRAAGTLTTSEGMTFDLVADCGFDDAAEPIAVFPTPTVLGESHWRLRADCGDADCWGWTVAR